MNNLLLEAHDAASSGRHADAKLNVLTAGEVARTALARSGGRALPLPGFADAPYLDAAGEIIWVGASLPALHPRAVVTAEPPPRGAVLQFDSVPEKGWSASPALPGAGSNGKVVTATGRLTQRLANISGSSGFGALITRQDPAFPLDIAAVRVRRLATAYRRHDVDGAVDASLGLLGLGAGLTPSGDDLVGAALFARRLTAARHCSWEKAAATLSAAVRLRSHAISAALFSDLARGESFAPLHLLAQALADDDDDAALAASHVLISIGHSSGWDMLTGFIIGITASLP